MFHRLREAMRDGAVAPMGGMDSPAGGAGIVEADETYIGCEPGMPKKRAYHHKMKVLSLVDRDTKQVRAVVVDDLKLATVMPILADNIAKEASLFTNEAGHYLTLGASFADHQYTSHGRREYVRGTVQMNTVKAISPSPTAALKASISTEARSTYTATSRNLTTGTTSVRSSV